jgi:hypothetical protein
MRRLGILFIVLLLMLGVPAGLLLLSPSTLIMPVTNYYLAEFGFRLTNLQQLKFDQHASQASHARILSDQLELEIQDVALEYSVSGLRQGQLPSLSIGQLTIQLNSNEGTDTGQGFDFSLANLLGVVSNIPFVSLRIENVTLATDSSRYQMKIELETQPTRLTGQLVVSESPDLQLHLNAQQSGPNNILGQATLILGNREAIASEFSLNSSDQIVEIEALNTLSLNVLTAIPLIEELLGPVVLLDNSVQAEASFTLDFSSEDPTIPELSLSIDAPNSIFQLSSQSAATVNELQLQLPINVTGAAASFLDDFIFSVPELYATLTQTTRGRDIEVEATFSEVSVQCMGNFSCQLQSQFNASNPLLELGPVQLENSSIEGSLTLVNNGNRIVGSIPLATIRLPEITNDFASSNLEIKLESVAINYAQELSVNLPFYSNSLELGIRADGNAPLWQGVELSDSSITGEFSLARGIIDLEATLSSKGQPLLSGTANHSLLDQSGSIEVALAEYIFSNITPLSSLLGNLPIEAELLAGKVAGEAGISWLKTSESAWDVEGPISLSIEDLGGFYNGVFFVDLNTDLRAIIGAGTTLRSSEKLSATVAKLDVGLPLENIQWQYQFNTGLGEITVDGLHTELLGGSASIPEFSYQAQRDENFLTLVLGNLELSTIASLAEYPGVYVDGLISGYLPIAIGSDKITIEKGLIGALNPGGTIRYTPANPIPSTNTSIQMVNEALSNYQYQIMNTEVDYIENGDLLMGIQLQGSNPDMNNGQQINLNINITDNIPTLLKSLQASRVISDALEQSLEQGN